MGLGCGIGTSLQTDTGYRAWITPNEEGSSSKPSHFVKESLAGPPALQTNSWGSLPAKAPAVHDGWALVLTSTSSGCGGAWRQQWQKVRLVTKELNSTVSPGPLVLSRSGGKPSLQGSVSSVKRWAGSGRTGDGQLAPELWVGTGSPREAGGKRPQSRAGRAVRGGGGGAAGWGGWRWGFPAGVGR